MKTILVDAVNTFVIPGSGKNQDMHDLLETFPERKIIVTNANDDEIQEYGLTDLPYELFSLRHNPDKTNPQYFQSLLAQFHLTPEDVVYFEHNPDVVKSAKIVGITTYHYDHHKKDLVALKKFLQESTKSK